MKRSFRILLIIAVVFVSALVAAFTVPVKHYTDYYYTGGHFYYSAYEDDIYSGSYLWSTYDGSHFQTQSHTHTIMFTNTKHLSFDFSWFH